MTKILLAVPPSAPPPLELARRRLDALQAEHDRVLADAEECGTDGELEAMREWGQLLARLNAARAEVARLEAEQLP